MEYAVFVAIFYFEREKYRILFGNKLSVKVENEAKGIKPKKITKYQ